MLVDEILRKGEAQAAALGAAGNQRVEDASLQLGWDAGAVVGDLDRQRVPVAAAGERDLARDARAQPDLAARGRSLQRLRRVAHDVEHRLDKLLPIALDQ